MNTDLMHKRAPGSSRIGRWLLITLAVMSVFAFLSVARSVSAEGSTRISGIAFVAGPRECTDQVTHEGRSPDFANVMTGDLEGCLYVFVETANCTPGGMYIETGTEIYVGGGSEGDEGTFRTTYRFTAKLDDCPNFIGQMNGRCQHPIIASSGTDDYDGVTGRLDFKDDLDAGNFPYTGNLHFKQ